VKGATGAVALALAGRGAFIGLSPSMSEVLKRLTVGGGASSFSAFCSHDFGQFA